MIIKCRIRQLVASIHRWVGRACALTVALLGVSGGVLTFGTEIDAALNPHLRRVAAGPRSRPVGELIRSVEAATGAVPSTLHFHEDPTLAVEAWLDRSAERRAFVDPYSARVLGVREERTSFVGAVRALHVELLAGKIGHDLVGALGLVLVALFVTGLLRWWPGRRDLKAALAVRRPVRGVRGAYDLHKAGGLWGGALVLLAGVTGAALVFSRPTAGLLGVEGIPTPRTAPRAAPLDVAEADRWIALADAALPGGRVVRLDLPRDATSPVRVRKRLQGEAHQNGMSFIHLDPAGAVLHAADARTQAPAETVLGLRFPIHTWSVLGRFGPLAALIAAAACVWLPLTGLQLWARRRRTRRSTALPVRPHPNPEELHVSP